MKSKLLILLALLLVATMLFAACGDGIVPEGLGTNTGNNPGTNSGNNSGNNGGNSQSGQSEAQYENDKKSLENDGYTVTMYTDRQALEAFESAGSLKSGSLEAYLTALSEDVHVVIYYFVSADDAAAYHAQYPGSALNGKAVAFGGINSDSNGNGGGNTSASEGINIDDDGLVKGEDFSGEVLLVPETAPDGTVPTAIDMMAFYDNSTLKKVVLPASVKTIKYQAFYDCTALAEINLENVSTIESAAFSGCCSLKTVTLGTGLSRIAADTFEGCKALESIVIPEGIENIGEYAFYDCASLKSVTLPASLDVLGEGAFMSTALAEINYGGTMDDWESLGKGTLLDNCPNLIVSCADGAVYHYVNGYCVD